MGASYLALKDIYFNPVFFRGGGRFAIISFPRLLHEQKETQDGMKVEQ